MRPPHHGSTIYSRRAPASSSEESSPSGRVDPIDTYVPIGSEERGRVVPSGGKKAKRLNGWQRLWIVLTVLGWLVSVIMLMAEGGGRGLSTPDYWLAFLAALAFITLAIGIMAGVFYAAGLIIGWVWRGFKSD